MLRSTPPPLLVALLLAGCGAQHATPPRISARPSSGPVDSAPRVVVSDASTGAVVVARARDARGRSFSSRTSVADLHRDPTRPLWTLAAGRDFFSEPLPQFRVRLDVVQKGRTVAHTTITRRTLARAVGARPVRGGLYGERFDPPRRGRKPAVLVLGGSEGGLATTGLAALLASHGYPAMALAYFRAPGLPGALENIPLEYFARALRRLRASPGVDARRVVILGISRGAEAALLIGATYPDLVHGVVALVPSNVVNPASDGRNPAWTLRGRAVPHVRAIDFGDPAPVRTPAAVIRAEHIDGPVLTASGGQDELWPSYLYADALQRRLTAHRFAHPHRNLYFDQAGHGLGVALPYLPTLTSRASGGTAAADEAAKTRLWPGILAYLRALGR